MTDAERRLKAIREINLPYDHQRSNNPAEELRLQLKATAGFEVELVEEAASMFTTGEVVGHSGEWRPSPAVVAYACRQAAARRNRRAYLDRLDRPRLPPPQVEKTPESRQRFRQMFAHFLGQPASRPDADTKTASTAKSWKRANDGFEPDMSEEAIVKRLGLHAAEFSEKTPVPVPSTGTWAQDRGVRRTSLSRRPPRERVLHHERPRGAPGACVSSGLAE
jgi:hypothetical protein